VFIVFYSYSPEGVTCSLNQRRIGWIAQIFLILLSFCTITWEIPFEYMENLTDPETRVFHSADGENLVILTCTVFTRES